MASFTQAVKVVVFVILAAVVWLAGMALWIISTVTMIGPAFQWCGNRRDKQLLDVDELVKKQEDMHMIDIPGKGYRVFVRHTVPTAGGAARARAFPVVIANGLGATAVTISRMHEALVAEGFTVLSYDRLGVGFSDANTFGRPPTVDEVVEELHAVVQAFLPHNQKWTVLGGSMGCVVAQCYIARHPGAVVGFVSLDGLPYPFCTRRTSFIRYAVIYSLYGSIVWTGALRAMMIFARPFFRNTLQSQAFSAELIEAQCNQKRFFTNLALEMVTMMDLTEQSDAGWGGQSVLRMSPADRAILANTSPDASVSIDPLTKRAISNPNAPRSQYESGSCWSSPDEVDRVLAGLFRRPVSSGMHDAEEDEEQTIRGSPNGSSDRGDNSMDGNEDSKSLLVGQKSPPLSSSRSPLTKAFAGMAVRVLSARNYDGITFFYDAEMRGLAAASHTALAKAGRTGKRYVFPNDSHMTLFQSVDQIVRCCVEVDDEANAAAASNV